MPITFTTWCSGNAQTQRRRVKAISKPPTPGEAVSPQSVMLFCRRQETTAVSRSWLPEISLLQASHPSPRLPLQYEEQAVITARAPDSRLSGLPALPQVVWTNPPTSHQSEKPGPLYSLNLPIFLTSPTSGLELCPLGAYLHELQHSIFSFFSGAFLPFLPFF